MEDMEKVVLHFANTTHTPTPRTFSLTLIPGIDTDAVRTMAESYVDCGWNLESVHFHTDMDYRNGPTVADIDSVGDALDIFETLEDNPNSVTRILAYGEMFGWDADSFVSGAWEEDYAYFEAWSDADLAEEMYEEFNEELMETVRANVYLSIDWEETAEQLRTDSAMFGERNRIHVLFI